MSISQVFRKKHPGEDEGLLYTLKHLHEMLPKR